MSVEASGRIGDVPLSERGIFVRIARWYGRRKLGRDVGPMKVLSHHARVLFGVAAMESALEGSGAVPGRVKCLAELQAARMVGCPF